MNKITSTLFLALLLSFNCYSQGDSLDVFRVPGKANTSLSKGANNAGNNALTISIGHIGRGGSLITYERFINNTSFSVFAGFGVTKIDYIGQYSIDNESFYYSSLYTDRKSVDLGRMFDLGAKYIFDQELGGNYFGLCFSSYTNSITQEVQDDYYKVVPFDTRTYRLDYSSKEFKIIYGAMNDIGERFYNDFFIGGGLRQIEYQQLNVTEVAQPNTSAYSYFTELSIEKKTKNDLKPWLFFGWKIGVRF